MSRNPSTEKPDESHRKRRKVLKSEVFGVVQAELIRILKRRDVGTVDLIHQRLDIHPSGLPAIGAAIADLKRSGLIERVDFGQTMRAIAHGRFVSVWRLKR
jgi:hypothetical protein